MWLRALADPGFKYSIKYRHLGITSTPGLAGFWLVEGWKPCLVLRNWISTRAQGQASLATSSLEWSSLELRPCCAWLTSPHWNQSHFEDTPAPSPREQAGFSRSVGAIGNVNSPFRVAFVWYVVLMYLTFNDLTEC